LYWAGRARESAGATGVAVDRYRLVVTDYATSYYGRLATARLRALKIPADTVLMATVRFSSAQSDTTPAVPTAELIAWLIRATLYDEALDEVVYAQRAWGRSPALEATRAWLLNRKGELRPGITAMRQTYPQFIAAGGDALPADVQRIIFPLDYWSLIRQYAVANDLDPYLVAALVAQESTFDPKIVSSANAIGLMQILPSTGRQWARRLGIRGYSTSQLTTPAINIRIGTAFFADLVKQFGGVYFALAGYNAGGYRVARWTAERPDLPREEFIDDIPFPETQNYVKRILGTAEDYRRLYAGTDTTASTPVIVKTAGKKQR
jgi:soluble lytic murein transglycosylase